VGKGTTFSNDFLKLVLNATAIANIADNATGSPLTNIQVGLHTADPGAGGNETTNETAYTGYARVAVARTTGGWTAASGGSSSPVASIDFGQCTASPGAALTHAHLGTAASGTGKLLYIGPLSPNITVAVGVIPRITTASTVTEA
jgi:hypothetical protein